MTYNIMPSVSIALLSVYAVVIVYLLLVGLTGMLYNEPVGYLYALLGVAITIPYTKAYLKLLG